MKNITRREAIKLASIGAASLAAGGALAACSGGSEGSSDSASSEKKKILLGTSTVCVDLAESGRAALEEMGYELEVTVFEDYFLPNESLAEGSTDANLYQHGPFLEQYNAEKGTDIIMLEPALWDYYAGIYSVKADSIEDLPEGGIVGLEQDANNIDYDLRCIQEAGLIKLTDEEKGLYSIADIVENPHNYEFKEADYNRFHNMDDYAFIFGTSNTMASYDVDPTQHLLQRFNEDGRTHGMCVMPENKDTQWAKDLMAAYTSESAREYVTPDKGFEAAF